MSIHQTLHRNIVDNPIQRRESMTLNRQRGKWFWRIMYAITALLFLSPVFWGFGRYFYDSVNVTLSLLIFANIVVFVLVVIRAVTHASDSMYRERRGKTWELLMLTGVSNWRVVFGKWLGIMRHLIRDFAWLFVVRLGTLVWASIAVNLRYDFTWQELASYNNSTVYLFDSRIGGGFFVMALALIAIFTIVELMLSSAIGLAVAFFKFKAKTASAVGMVVRVGLAVLIPIMTYLFFAYGDGDRYIFGVDYGHYDEQMMFFATRTSTFLADNGMVSAVALTDEASFYDDEFITVLGWANLAGVLMYVAFTGFALLVAANRAYVRGLDFENGKVAKAKLKRPVPVGEIVDEQIIEEINPKLAVEASHVNVFGFEDADSLSVDIHHYQHRLGRMILRVSGGQLPVYVQLSNVAYMEAPAFWKGAHFHTASDAEYQAFVQEKGIYINGLTEDAMRLYVLEGKASVRIVAGTAQILEELPHNL